MKKGTILYIGGFELPDKNAAAHRVLNNGKILKSLGYNVVFVGIDKSLSSAEKISNTKKDIEGFESWSIPYPRKKLEWIKYLTNIDFMKFINQNYKDIEAVICYNYQSVAFIKMKKLCKIKGIKVIADCTEWYSTEGERLIFKLIKGIDSFLRMRIIQKKVDGIIVISKYLYDFYGNTTKKIYLPPLTDLKESKWHQEKIKLDNGETTFVYAGSPGKNKDKVNYVIEALSKLPKDIKFIFYIIGITKEQYLEDYKEHEQFLNQLNNKIFFLGRLSNAESIQYLKSVDYSMFIREETRVTKAGFPTKFAESMSSGIPIITSKSSDLEYYLENGETGFFTNSPNIEDIVSVLIKTLTLDEQDAQRMKYNAKRARMTFDYTSFIREFAVFLEKII